MATRGRTKKAQIRRTTGKGGNYRSTKSGAGMTAKGVAAYNRKTGGNLKTAVTEKNAKGKKELHVEDLSVQE